MMTRRRRIYEGKGKILYEGPEPGTLVQFFKDDATAFNKKKHEIVDGKGVLNNRISEYVFTHLNKMGIPTHFIRRLNMREQLVRAVEIIPLEVVVRNVAAGSLAKRIGWEEGTPLPQPIVETYYKKDELGDPMLAPTHVAMLGLVSPERWAEVEASALEVNRILKVRWAEAGLTLVDFKLEYGVTSDGEVVLGDEISPDTSRLWDTETGDRKDKDVFRRDLADLVETYTEVLGRLGLDD